jgi:pyruvate dehydrogenase E1 component
VQAGRQADAARAAAGLGTILRESIAAQELLEKDWGVAADVWSCPSFNELTRDGQDCERWNLLHPTDTPRVPFVAQQLKSTPARWWHPPTT